MRVYAVYEFGVLTAIFRHESDADDFLVATDLNHEVDVIEIPDELFH